MDASTVNADSIRIKGARLHNLRNVSLAVPKNKLVVLTGLSGSGKSTLAFDTLHREGQRQYLESLGMVTGFVSKPAVDSITGLSPSISVDQHLTNRSPRSTVGTVTEVFTYLRLLWARIGHRPCPACGQGRPARVSRGRRRAAGETSRPRARPPTPTAKSLRCRARTAGQPVPEHGDGHLLLQQARRRLRQPAPAWAPCSRPTCGAWSTTG